MAGRLSVGVRHAFASPSCLHGTCRADHSTLFQPQQVDHMLILAEEIHTPLLLSAWAEAAYQWLGLDVHPSCQVELVGHVPQSGAAAPLHALCERLPSSLKLSTTSPGIFSACWSVTVPSAISIHPRELYSTMLSGVQTQKRLTEKCLLKYEVAVASRNPPNVPGRKPVQVSTGVSAWSLRIICETKMNTIS